MATCQSIVLLLAAAVAVAAVGAQADGGDDVILAEPCLTIYVNGSYVRSCTPPATPAGFNNATGVVSRDVVVDVATGIFVREFLPASSQGVKLPVVIFFHGGGLVLGSAVAQPYHPLAETFAYACPALVVSVQYRLAPEHPCDTQYDDCWTAVQWTVSGVDSWIAEHGDLSRLFFAGDSAGGNIVHQLMLRAGAAGKPAVEGGVLLHPGFMGERILPTDNLSYVDVSRKLWKIVCPTAKAGLDDPRMNPLAKGAPSLLKLACRRLFVAVAGADPLWVRGMEYLDVVTLVTGRPTELVISRNKTHDFFVVEQDSEESQSLLKRVVAFVNRH